MTKHTGAPWEWHYGVYGYVFFEEDKDVDGFHIRMPGPDGVEKIIDYAETLHPSDGEQYEEAEANVRLMTASPKLYAVLDNIDHLEVSPDLPAWLWEDIREVMAEVRGDEE